MRTFGGHVFCPAAAFRLIVIVFKYQHFARFNVAYKLGAYKVKRTGFGSHNPAAVHFANRQRAEAVLVTHGNKFVVRHNQNAESAFNGVCCFGNTFFNSFFTAAGNKAYNNFRINRCLENRTFQSQAFAISAGAVIRTVTTTIDEGFSLPKVEKFEELINERTKGILICNPNNPTGYLYTRREMNQIRDLVKKYDLFLFSDEVYREFIYTGSPYISACHLEGIEQNVVLIDSVSKRYSECGIRIGALITKNPEVRKAVMKFCQARLSPPLIGQIAAEASLDEPEEYARETYDEYVERRKCLIDGLNRIPGVYSPIPMGAFYTVAKLPVDDCEKFCAWCLSDFNYEGETVMMAPASGFYTTPGGGKNEVRVAYVLKKEDLVRALFILRKALEAYPGRVDE